MCIRDSNVYSNFNRTYCENELDDDIMELISKYTASSEFADLHEEVQKAYEQAVGSDANLKTMLETTLTGAIKPVSYTHLDVYKRQTFDNGTTCVLYRTEAVRYSIMEGAFISEADYEKLISEVVGKRAKKRALHLLEPVSYTHLLQCF